MPSGSSPSERPEGTNLKEKNLMIRSIWSKARESETVDAIAKLISIAVLLVGVLVIGVALGAGPAGATPPPKDDDEGTVEVFWAMHSGGTPENVTWPQLHSPAGAVECGVWYQVDTYTPADAARFTKDGVLEYGEDHGYAISWRFVYGGDCLPPPVLPDPESRTTVTEGVPSCEDGTVEITTVGEHRGAYLGDDGQVHWGEWVETSREVTTRNLTEQEAQECEPEPTEPPTTAEPTEPPTTDKPTEPTEPEPTTPVEPEPTTPVEPEPTTPVEPEPTSAPSTVPVAQQRTVTPDVPVVDEQRTEVLAETGSSDWAACGILGALTLVLLGVVMVAVHRIRGRR